ncbi:ERMES complex subunit mmm1 [Schaereria dolodes]|nr:ERMES complex subunit mmm1 [Schaereria dolodes]
MTSPDAQPPSPPQQSSSVCFHTRNTTLLIKPPSLSFTQGFLLGQLSVVILIFAFIKFFIFGEPLSAESTASRALAHPNLSRTHRRSISVSSSSLLPSKPSLHTKRSSTILRSPSHLTTAAILSKTYYNVDAHQPESLDWFNVLIAQTIAQFRIDAHHDDAILTSLTAVLNGHHKPDFLDGIAVTEISLGEDFPIFSNCRVHPVADDDGSRRAEAQGPGHGQGRLQARMDVDLSDFITLGVETKIVLNYPKPFTAILPIALSVSVVRFSGTLSISFLPSTSSSSSTPNPNSSPPSNPDIPSNPLPTALAFSFLPDYRLSLSTRSLLGSRSRLQDVPKIAQLVESRLHAWFDERCVEPRMQQVALPSLWPRMGRMKVGGGGGGGGEEEEEKKRGEEGGGIGEGVRWRGGNGAQRRKEEEVEKVEEDSSGGRGLVDMPSRMPGMMVA